MIVAWSHDISQYTSPLKVKSIGSWNMNWS